MEDPRFKPIEQPQLPAQIAANAQIQAAQKLLQEAVVPELPGNGRKRETSQLEPMLVSAGIGGGISGCSAVLATYANALSGRIASSGFARATLESCAQFAFNSTSVEVARKLLPEGIHSIEQGASKSVTINQNLLSSMRMVSSPFARAVGTAVLIGAWNYSFDQALTLNDPKAEAWYSTGKGSTIFAPTMIESIWYGAGMGIPGLNGRTRLAIIGSSWVLGRAANFNSIRDKFGKI